MKLFSGCALFVACTTVNQVAVAQAPFPAKPIRLIAPSSAGGPVDVIARIVAQGWSEVLGEQIVVDNRAGAAGMIGAEMVAKAAPDGYTLLLGFSGPLVIVPQINTATPYDVMKDFAPISLAASAPYVLLVHPSVPAKSVKELVALAKAQPGQLNYASGSTGSSPHLAAELFKALAHVNIVRISYRGNALAYADVLRGEVPLIFPTAASVAPHLKSGRLRALAVTTKERSRLFPALPTVAESGVPGYESATLVGVFVPAGTPAAIVTRLSQEIAAVLKLPEVQERFLNTGVEPVGSSPEEFGALVKSEMSRLGPMIKAAGIRDE